MTGQRRHTNQMKKETEMEGIFFFSLSLSLLRAPSALRDADLATIAALSFVASALFCSRWTAISRAAVDRIRLSCVFFLFFYFFIIIITLL